MYQYKTINSEYVVSLILRIWPINLKMLALKLHRIFNTSCANAVMSVPLKLAQQRNKSTVKLPKGKFARLYVVVIVNLTDFGKMKPLLAINALPQYV